MSNNSLSDAPDTDEQSGWRCPYCNRTQGSLSDVREHITESTDGDHRGVDGLKPTRDIVAYGTTGEEVERIEGVSTEPADPIDEYDKRELIINAWLAAEGDLDRDAIEAVSGASQQYVSQLLTELASGEIPRETYIDVLDYGLKNELEERIKQYNADADTSEDSLMSAEETATPEDVIDASTKKERIIAAHRISPTANKNAIADALDVSYEYVRQIFNDIDNRGPETWKKLQEADLEEDPEPALRDAVEQRLREKGVLTGRERQERAETVSRDSVEGMVATEDIADVREKVELLLEQAKYTGKADAKFATQKTIEWLDELLEESK